MSELYVRHHGIAHKDLFFTYRYIYILVTVYYDILAIVCLNLRCVSECMYVSMCIYVYLCICIYV